MCGEGVSVHVCERVRVCMCAVSVHVCVRVGMHSLGFADMKNTSVVHATSSAITHSVESDKVVQCKHQLFSNSTSQVLQVVAKVTTGQRGFVILRGCV